MTSAERKRVTSDALIKIREGLTKLKELPEKPKEKKSTESLHALLKEFIPVIDEAKEKGYSLAEIVSMINDNHLKGTNYTLTLSNFRSNITRLNMELKKHPAKKRGKKNKTVADIKNDKDDNAGDAVAPNQSIAQQVAKDTPPSTGVTKATDLKAGKEALFGKDKK